MRGDKLHITAEHRRAGEALAMRVLGACQRHRGIFVVTIGGESGSGKSELAEVLRGVLDSRGVRATILQQDDYFVYPPLTNDAVRRKDIGWVGMSEVRLDLLDEHLAQARGGTHQLCKPLVIYQEDRITEETVDLSGIRVLIVEGTYTTSLRQVDLRVFIERDYRDTRAARLARGREMQDAFLESILALEHAIISQQRPWAELVVTRDYRLAEQELVAPAEQDQRNRCP